MLLNNPRKSGEEIKTKFEKRCNSNLEKEFMLLPGIIYTKRKQGPLKHNLSLNSCTYTCNFKPRFETESACLEASVKKKKKKKERPKKICNSCKADQKLYLTFLKTFLVSSMLPTVVQLFKYLMNCTTDTAK